MERLPFNSETWYQNLALIAGKTSTQRYEGLVSLHGTTLEDYINALNQITEEQAEAPGVDGRKRKIVVAHIMGWEEWQTQVFADPQRKERLNKQLHMECYQDPQTEKMMDFPSVDEFNAHQEKLYKNWSWNDIRNKAIATANHLRSFFPDNPSAVWLTFLDSKPTKEWHVTKDITLTVPGAWYLWMVSLEHEAVEHRKDLFV